MTIMYKNDSLREYSSNAAYIDKLTKLPNRSAFDTFLTQQLTAAKKKGKAFSLMLVDVDRFKYINGYLGYELGDQLLLQISQRLKLLLTDQVFLYRFSGDQFAFIFSQMGKREDNLSLANNILHLFDYPFSANDQQLDVAVKIGISMYPHDAQDMGSLLKFANSALLRCKVAGKKRYEFYSADIENENNRQFLLGSNMHNALEKGQFKVHYQPIVNLRTDEVLAVEALLRWDHPKCGMVSPAEFIPIMEETGFIVEVGKWVLKEVCRNHKQWQAAGLSPIKVSVNYSSIQFAEECFVENIRTILHQEEFNPHNLIIEITESIFMDDPDKVIADFQKLQQMGIMIAVDDFGTGFSSLSYLSDFNIDILKIDRSFIQQIPVNKSSTIITRSVINLARELNIKLVAEGIETQEQLSYLQQFNCQTGQGYLYSKPIPQHELAEILARRTCQPHPKISK